MTNTEILTKAIQKATDGGWVINPYEAKHLAVDALNGYEGWTLESVIFNHDFAKALWGEQQLWVDPRFDKDVTNRFRTNALSGNKNWQYHLQQMVIEENPIKYLGEHLDE